MLPKLKNNFFGYFLFFHRVIGNKIFLFFLLSITVSVLDGIGLAMFMPLIQSVAGGDQASKASMGQLHHFADALTSMGLPLTLGTVLGTLVVLFSLKGF